MKSETRYKVRMTLDMTEFERGVNIAVKRLKALEARIGRVLRKLKKVKGALTSPRE